MRIRILSRVILIVVSILTLHTLFCQSNKFSLSIEYSPNFSKITDEVVDAKHKLSHNAILRLEYRLNAKLNPTIGLGFFNAGETLAKNIGGEMGVNDVKYIYNHNYIIIPIGANVSLDGFYILPEVGLGINITNNTKYVIEFSNGETETEIRAMRLNSGDFNDYTLPFYLSFGKYFNLESILLSVGLKGYYGLNQLVKDVPRNNHYYGGGIVVGVKM